MKDSRAYHWFLLIVLAIVWGSSFILIKRALVPFDPVIVGSLRLLAAGSVLLVPAIKRLKRVRSRHFPWLVSVGFAGSLLPAYLFATAQTKIDSAVAGVVNGLTPLFVILVGLTLFGQRSNMRVIVGLIIGFIGLGWLVLSGANGDLSVNYYSLFVVVATICYGFNVNIIKFRLADIDAITITSISISMAGILAAIILFSSTDFITVTQTHPQAWMGFGAAVLLGIMSTAIALILFNHLVKLTTPVFSSSVTYLIPIVAFVWGIWDGEILVLGQIFGMLTILVGVFLANRPSSKPKT